MPNPYEGGNIVSQRELYAQVKAKYPDFYEALKHYMYEGPEEDAPLTEKRRWKEEQQVIIKQMQTDLEMTDEELGLMYKAVAVDVEGHI